MALYILIGFVLFMALSFADSPSGAGATGGGDASGGGEETSSTSGDESSGRMSAAVASRAKQRNRERQSAHEASKAKAQPEESAEEPESPEQWIDAPEQEAEPESEAQEAVAEVPAPSVRPAEDAQLVSICHQAGINPNFLQKFSNVSDAEAALEYILEQRATQAAMPQGAERQQVKPPDEFKFAWPELPGDHFTPEQGQFFGGINKQVEAMHAYYKQRLEESNKLVETNAAAMRKIVEHLRRGEAQQMVDRIDASLGQAGEVYQPFIGKGSLKALDPKSKEHQWRSQLIKETITLMDRLGEPEDRAIKTALFRLFGDKIKEQARTETAKAVDERKKLMIHKPTKPGSATDKRDPKKAAIAAVAEEMRRQQRKAS